MILQDPSADPEQLAEQVRRVMARPEFRYDKSWFDRLSDWIARQLERLFGGEPSGGTIDTGSGFAGGIGSILAWLLILAAVAAVVAVVVYVVRHRVRAATSRTDPTHRSRSSTGGARRSGRRMPTVWSPRASGRPRCGPGTASWSGP